MKISRRSSLLALPGLVAYSQTATTQQGWKELTLGPAKRGGRNQFDGLALRLENVPLRSLVAHAHGLPFTGLRVDGPDSLNHEVAITAVPDTTDPQAARDALRALLTSRCNLAVHQEKRKMPVKILRVASLKVPKSPKEDNGPRGIRVSNGTISGVGAIGSLVPHIEYRADNTIVVDETGLTGNYRLELSWESGNTDSFFVSLTHQLGLEVTSGMRDIEMLIVDRCETPSETK